MAGRALMIQGCGSDAGKSTLVCALARAYRRRGYRVAPFKPQNMSNNAAVTTDGGEIGRAQALQAQACGLDPIVDMNPVLLKPEAETGAQVVVRGEARARMSAHAYRNYAPTLMRDVLASYERIKAETDLVLVEGAGSPAEVNLRDGDIANMGFACKAGCPVILVVDIERGGAIAALVGTQAVLSKRDNDQIKGFLVNRFRGDISLFDGGRTSIVDHTGWKDCGVMPWVPEASKLPLEDSASLGLHVKTSSQNAKLQITAIRYPRISNTDDLDPFLAEPDVSLRLCAPEDPLPVDTDLVLLLGSKAVISDLRALKAAGMDADIKAHVRRGGHVVGLCGGYQMMGGLVTDPDGLEGPPGDSETGLGLLPTTTRLGQKKILKHIKGRSFCGHSHFSGYEIHLGTTEIHEDSTSAWLETWNGESWTPQGICKGTLRGAYVHGAFASEALRSEFLKEIMTGDWGQIQFEQGIEDALDALADAAEAHLCLDSLLHLAR